MNRLGGWLRDFNYEMYNLLIGWNLFPFEPNAKIEVMGGALTNLPCYLSYRHENINELLLLHIYMGINAEWFNKNYQEYTLSKTFQSTWTENVNQVNLISLLEYCNLLKVEILILLRILNFLGVIILLLAP